HLPESPPRLLPSGPSSKEGKSVTGPTTATLRCPASPDPSDSSTPLPLRQHHGTSKNGNIDANENESNKAEDDPASSFTDSGLITTEQREAGPLPTDIHPVSSYLDSPRVDFPSYESNTELDSSQSDDEYDRALADRARLRDDETARQRVREDLETYVSSLSPRVDESGDHLLEFPKNYPQILALMTQKDVCDEDSDPKTDANAHQSWSRVLIQSGLSKQQAFGVLEGGDDDAGDDSGLAAKIALKMAHIRQLDAILEAKLGKSLYSTVAPRKPKKREQQQQREANQDQVVANGMRANLTRDEETRLENLLRDDSVAVDGGMVASPIEGEGADVGANSASAARDRSDFAMSDADKQAIQELITAKSGAHPLMSIDELQPGFNDDAPVLPLGSGTPAATRPKRENALQETKQERLQRQRLSRIEQELRFLHESQSVVIVGDDQDEEIDEEIDDCRSESSYATVASVAASSTCSTRSGVISRHEFNCFLAQQKDAFRSTPIASSDEIRRLLLSMTHLTSAPSNAVTATTG
ncbi:hypothetical protein BBJ28_00025810, partial [Nothophytophthora sp. Chile5]